eukprot:scaffold24676_cov61-Phaeocystis_antarctica.AAC.7
MRPACQSFWKTTARRLLARKIAFIGKTERQSIAGKIETTRASVLWRWADQFRLHEGSMSSRSTATATRPSDEYMTKVLRRAAPKIKGNSRLRPSGCSSDGTPIWKSWQKTPMGTIIGRPSHRTSGSGCDTAGAEAAVRFASESSPKSSRPPSRSDPTIALITSARATVIEHWKQACSRTVQS